MSLGKAMIHARKQKSAARAAAHAAEHAVVAMKHILVIDDIYTTGATARATAQALREAGAASVWIATLARAQMIGTRSDFDYLNDDPNEKEEDFGLPENGLPGPMQEASIPSSQDQPSF